MLDSEEVDVTINPFKAVVSSLSSGDTAGAVDLVDVKTPVLHVWQNPTDKSWNVTKLFKSSRPINRWLCARIFSYMTGLFVLLRHRENGRR